MQDACVTTGRQELRQVLGRNRALIWAVALFSLFANLLMLTGPLYMLQVYDRVLGSGSLETLVALSILVAFLYGVMGLLDYARGRIMARVGARFQDHLDARVFDAVIRKSAVAPDLGAQTGLSDVHSVQRFLTSSLFLALFDMPWTPVFFAGIFIFHPLLGCLALIGAGALIALTLANQVLTKQPQGDATLAAHRANVMAEQIRTEAEMVQAMGMRGAGFARWQALRHRALCRDTSAKDVGGACSSLSKTLRLVLQSAMLGVGAWLVLRNELTAGAMIAASILLGRALSPVETALARWPILQRSGTGWRNLARLLGTVPAEAPRTPLPRPVAHLDVRGLTVTAPGEKLPALKNISFEVVPGEALGIIGPSGAGKSTLARALTGVWRPATGSIRLDGAALDHYDSVVLGGLIGYLPQRVQLFDGTIAENIARLDTDPDPDKVVAAAKAAAAHEMILELPHGYDTPVVADQVRLSGGQMQRIGLARALYDDPVIVILDEPNSNLDNVGSKALNTAVRRLKSDGRSVLIMAHRPAAIQECEALLVLDDGVCASYGAKDEVLSGMVRNHKQIKSAAAVAKGVA